MSVYGEVSFSELDYLAVELRLFFWVASPAQNSGRGELFSIFPYMIHSLSCQSWSLLFIVNLQLITISLFILIASLFNLASGIWYVYVFSDWLMNWIEFHVIVHWSQCITSENSPMFFRFFLFEITTYPDEFIHSSPHTLITVKICYGIWLLTDVYAGEDEGRVSTLSDVLIKPKMWISLVDDWVFIIRRGKLENIYNLINNIFSDKHFIIEKELDSKLSLFIISTTRTDTGKLENQVYHKPTHIDQIPNYSGNNLRAQTR